MAARWLAPAFALAVLMVTASSAVAEKGDLTVEFSTDPVEAKGKLTDLDVRPNTGQSFYLFLRNKSADHQNVRVQVVSSDGRQVLAEGKLRLLKMKDDPAVRVVLTKPAPPMPAAPAVAPAAATTPAPPMPMAPPPPPGVEIKLSTGENNLRNFVFRVRIFDDRTAAAATAKNEAEKPGEDVPVVIGIRQPTDYVKPDTINFKRSATTNSLTATFKSDKDNFGGPSPCPVELSFPPQKAIKVSSLREGVRRRTLTEPNQTVRLYEKDLPITGAAELGTFHINIDGVPRAYVYSHSFTAETDEKGATVDKISKSAIRYAEADQVSPPETVLMTRPRVLPVRVEADTTNLANAPFELRIKELPKGDLIEAIAKDEKRERHAYLDAASMDGGVFVTTRVGDWVIPLDLKDLRGKYSLQAVLKDPDPTKPDLATFDRTLVVDDTKPEEFKLEVMPGAVKEKNGTIRHLKTLPIKVQADPTDPESGISKVVFFLGKIGPDGKLPEGAVLGKKASNIDGAPWLAMLTLPAEPPAPPVAPGTPPTPPAPPKIADVTAVAINGVGIASEPVSVKIQLIDPPTGGDIKGTVVLSKLGKPIADVPVILKNAENKEVSSAKTNDKGIFEMKNVAPGAYRLFAARPDSGVGTKGEEPVRVEAGVEKKVTIILTRKP